MTSWLDIELPVPFLYDMSVATLFRKRLASLILPVVEKFRGVKFAFSSSICPLLLVFIPFNEASTVNTVCCCT